MTMMGSGGSGAANDLLALAHATADPAVLEERLEQIAEAEDANSRAAKEASAALEELAKVRNEVGARESAIAGKENILAEREHAVSVIEQEQVREAQRLADRKAALDSETKTRHGVLVQRESALEAREKEAEAKEQAAAKRLKEANEILEQIGKRHAAVQAALEGKSQEPAHL